MAEHSYSVWAIPPADVKSRLKSLMASLRSEFGGPAFDPHITVVGNLRLRLEDAVSSLHSASHSLKPFTASISAVSHGTFFYQCVYLLVDPSPEVLETSAYCYDLFGYKSATPYMPHLSLIYGDLSDDEKVKAEKRAEEIDPSICGLAFRVSLLALYKTDAGTDSWELVDICDLKN